MEQQNVNMQQEYEIEIDLKKIIGALLKRWYVIALAGLLAAGLMFGYTQYYVPEKYESKTTIFILNHDESNLTYSDLQFATVLTKDYEILIKSRAVLEETIKNLKLNTTYDVLKSMVKVAVPEDTRIVEIAVRTVDSKSSQAIADEVREVASKKIAEVMKVDAVNLIDKANLPTKKCSPNVMKNTVMGGTMGAFVACAVILIFAALNDTIRTQEDVEKYLNLSTLGAIPLDRKTEAAEKKRLKKERRKK